ncbi:unnamed protein product [Adineta steineri]|uniref:Tetraspanin n=1 Tax=Adineta steineri TaxID=433720 RepID=A0A815LVY6_9BILA|nr:unnamed protein product [Adineta steineri]CAF3733324.1 unnamed protein product [Adineta steineri]
MVRLSCGIQFIRTILFVLNIICLLIDFLLLIIGIHIKVNGKFSVIIITYDISQIFEKEVLQRIGILMIIIGIATICLAIFGCLGTVYHNRDFLYIYSIILSLIIVFEFVGIIITLRFRNDFWELYNSNFENMFQRAYRNNQTEIIRIIEQFEQDRKCCGVNSHTDYIKYGYRIPSSCYPNQILQENSFSQSCAEAIVIWIWNELPMIVAILASIFFIELFGVISSLVLGVAITHSLNTDFYDKL